MDPQFPTSDWEVRTTFLQLINDKPVSGPSGQCGRISSVTALKKRFIKKRVPNPYRPKCLHILLMYMFSSFSACAHTHTQVFQSNMRLENGVFFKEEDFKELTEVELWTETGSLRELLVHLWPSLV